MMLAAFLNVQNERAMVIGGGAVAARRIPALLAAGLQVTVMAPAVSAGVRAQGVALMLQPYRPGALSGARLVLVCTDDPQVNDAAAAEALHLGLLVCHAGNAAAGNFVFPATLEREGVQVAVHTGGQLPMLAQALKERLDAALPAHLPTAAWNERRAGLLTLGSPARDAGLDALRTEIRRTLGVGA